jgi:putative GTP pyrophosphokinase
MQREEEFKTFLQGYETHIKRILKPAYGEIRSVFDGWQRPEYWSKYAPSSGSAYPSPIKSIFTRIKRPEKVVDKIFQKPEEYPDGLACSSYLKMHDTIGVRVIVYFLSQIPFIDRELRTSEDIEISEQQPPEAYIRKEQLSRLGLGHLIQKDKESGYASIHYVLRLKKSKIDEGERPWFELQVRTIAQELWSEMEHILAYKPEVRTGFSARRRLQILSNEISAIDEHFNLLYEELVQKQEEIEYEDNDLVNAENLPAVMAEIGIRCAQQDLNTILTLLLSRGIRRVGDFIKLAAPKRLETIHNTYVAKTGRPPTSFELIASLGALKGVEAATDERKHILFHIKYGKVWNKIRKTLETHIENPPDYFK